jgi:hypothetical protein
MNQIFDLCDIWFNWFGCVKGNRRKELVARGDP